MSAALAPLASDVTWILDSGFDDVAMWSAIWAREATMVCRLQHHDRWVETPQGTPRQLADLVPRPRPLAHLTTELVAQQAGQPRPTLQPVTATVSATPLAVRWAPGLRTAAAGEALTKACWLAPVRLAHVAQEPWWLLTDRPVETAEQAAELFRMHRQRWAIEDAFKVAKTCLGWEDVQGLGYEAVWLLVALGKIVLTRGLRRLMDY